MLKKVLTAIDGFHVRVMKPKRHSVADDLLYCGHHGQHDLHWGFATSITSGLCVGVFGPEVGGTTEHLHMEEMEFMAKLLNDEYVIADLVC